MLNGPSLAEEQSMRATEISDKTAGVAAEGPYQMAHLRRGM